MDAQKYLLKKYPQLEGLGFGSSLSYNVSIRNIIDTMEEYSSYDYYNNVRNKIEQIEISITLETGEINKTIFVDKGKIRELMKDDTLNRLFTDIIASAE